MNTSLQSVPSVSPHDFVEDLDTRWVPDVLADVDAAQVLGQPRLTTKDVRPLMVPRAGGGHRPVAMLSGHAMAALRQGVEQVRDYSDGALHPLVCGYRRGAGGPASYSEEYRRFRSTSSALAESHRYVVVADVENFFQSVTLEVMRRSMTGGPFERDLDPIAEVVERLNSIGSGVGIPAGYGDARLIANVLLNCVDADLPDAMTRWVDDYRVFTNTLSEAESILARLERRLGETGLRLNGPKSTVASTQDYLRNLHGAPLDSVYHPQDEEPDQVRANLRHVFLQAANSGSRRQLRFVLPRLREQLDSIAVDYAFSELARGSLDAARLVDYLSAFAHSREFSRRVEVLALDSVPNEWTFYRLLPLLAQADRLSHNARDRLAHRLWSTTSPIEWGLVLRTLSLHSAPAVIEEIRRHSVVPDVRAAIGALADLGVEVPDELTALEPTSAGVVAAAGRAPSPSPRSIL